MKEKKQQFDTAKCWKKQGEREAKRKDLENRLKRTQKE